MLVLVDDALGQRNAREAADLLVKKGNQRVSVLEGGLASWRREGLPLVEKDLQVRGVTADELKWALAQSVPLKVYDLRNEQERKQGTIAYAEAAPGKSIPERIESLRSKLSKVGKNKDLAARMKKPEPVVLIFSASEDAAGHTRKLLLGTKDDVRYLIGGYESTVSDILRTRQTQGACPTCPGAK
jgi:rhodanese-related sulfurtransferase